MTIDKSTEKRILEAARQIFQKKGLAGARMQEIAEMAGINKAMLHYYFRSKEQLFEAVFTEAFREIIPAIANIWSSDMPLFGKIRFFISTYIDILIANPQIPGFVLHELSQNPQRMVSRFVGQRGFDPLDLIGKMSLQLEDEVEMGNINPVQPEQFFVTMLSGCVFPFVGKPMIQAIFGMDDAAFRQFLESRKTVLAEFVINAIRKK